MDSAVIRVKRKRSEDPQNALIVSFKRRRRSSGSSAAVAAAADGSNSSSCELYRFSGTAYSLDEDVVSAVLPADFRLDRCSNSGRFMVDLEAENIGPSELDPLAAFANFTSPPEGDGKSTLPPPPPPTETSSQSQIHCNGVTVIKADASCRKRPSNVPIGAGSSSVMDDFVYDLYIGPKRRNAISPLAEPELCASDRFVEARWANPTDSEAILVFGGEQEYGDEEEERADDEDDSNDEDNWRNDYPDKEDVEFEEENTSSSSESAALLDNDDFDQIGGCFMNKRLQRFRICDDDDGDIVDEDVEDS